MKEIDRARTDNTEAINQKKDPVSINGKKLSYDRITPIGNGSDKINLTLMRKETKGDIENSNRKLGLLDMQISNDLKQYLNSFDGYIIHAGVEQTCVLYDPTNNSVQYIEFGTKNSRDGWYFVEQNEIKSSKKEQIIEAATGLITSREVKEADADRDFDGVDQQ